MTPNQQNEKIAVDIFTNVPFLKDPSITNDSYNQKISTTYKKLCKEEKTEKKSTISMQQNCQHYVWTYNQGTIRQTYNEEHPKIDTNIKKYYLRRKTK